MKLTDYCTYCGRDITDNPVHTCRRPMPAIRYDVETIYDDGMISVTPEGGTTR